MSMDSSQPFLRTLAPLLRSLDRRLRDFLDARRRFPVPIVARAEVEGLADDLKRKADSLDTDRPLLIIMLMGGTGVGKSTLLNALAGDAVAQASFQRPTTRDPVVYHHQAVKADRLDPALRLCRLVQHDREPLLQKVLVDTPDIDSNDLANRETLVELLPIADVVLYVGSQEKYHDQIGWELFKEHRQRRAFAFVMNKWDRCRLDADTPGVQPDEDWLRDLTDEGFANPRLFRTTAQLWVDAAKRGRFGDTPADLPEGEQFAQLREWLELGLTRLEIEAVKARGVGQLLTQTEQALTKILPPDLAALAVQVQESWEKTLAGEADAQADVLVGTLEPYQYEVEHHFSVQSQQRFRGLMAGYLRLTTKLKYIGSNLRDHIPLTPKLGAKLQTPAEWNLTEFAQTCAHSAGERVLDRRMTALSNRLLIDADQRRFPLATLNDRTEDAAKLNWVERTTRAVVESLMEVEREATKPTGWRKYLRGFVTFAGNVMPEVVLVACIAVLLWRFFVEDLTPEFFHVLLPVYVTLGVLVVIHILILMVLPVRWGAIRHEFRTRLEDHLQMELNGAFLTLPQEVAETVNEEKHRMEEIIHETREVGSWLHDREEAAHIGELYGK